MLSSLIKPFFAKAIAPIGRSLVRCGVTPNTVTIVGTAGTITGALALFSTGNLTIGALLCGAFAVFDMLDGAVARAAGGGTRFGAVLDASCDRIADGAIFGSLAYWFAVKGGCPGQYIFIGLLISLVCALTISYIKARAEASGFSGEGGWIERPERLVIILVGAGVTGLGLTWAMPWVVAVLSVLSVITVVQRLLGVWKEAQRPEKLEASLGDHSTEPQ